MSEFILSTALLITAMSLVWHFTAGFMYDLHQARAQKRYVSQPHARRYRQRPLVSIIVLAHDNESSILHCLESIAKTGYRKIQVIVVDAASTDRTKHRVRQYIKLHPKLELRLCAKRRPACQKDQVSTGLRYVKGEMLLVLKATQFVDRQTLKNAVFAYNDDPELSVITTKRLISQHAGAISLVQSQQLQLWSRLQKNRSPSRHNGFCSGNFYALNRTTHNTKYIQTSCVYDPPLRSIFSLVQYRYSVRAAGSNIAVRLALSLSAGLLFVYAVYAAVRLQNTTPYMLCLAVLAIIIVEAVVSDDHMSGIRKATLLLLTPLSQVALSLLVVVELLLLPRASLRR